jgi:hypothetical protein
MSWNFADAAKFGTSALADGEFASRGTGTAFGSAIARLVERT